MYKATVIITTRRRFDGKITVAVEFDPPIRPKDEKISTVEAMAARALKAILTKKTNADPA